ncbi:MAG: DUF192 domain-containing protein [Nitrospira sp.]|nr:DUF192 domain-containing protein [Nitrospira sp.]
MNRLIDHRSHTHHSRWLRRLTGCLWSLAVVASSCAGWAADLPTETLIAVKMPNGTVIQAELADTALKRAQGLMFRERLGDDRGMLFIFGDAQPWTFWMKNTKIPLDIIWMDAKKTIVHIERNTPICTRQDDGCPQYHSEEGALYVLELGAGRAAALQLQRGVKLSFKQP